MVVKSKKTRPMVVCYPPDDVPMMEDPDNPGTLIPDDTWLITEDGAPVDSGITEKEARLLTEPLYTNWSGPDGKSNFMAMSDIGLFFSPTEPPLVPDAMLVVNPKRPSVEKGKWIRSYCVWRYKKMPDVVIEIVSSRKGGEATRKLKKYAEIGVSWYAIFDPGQKLSKEILRIFRLEDGELQPHAKAFFPEVGLGLTVWTGDYEDWRKQLFLRWCDKDGVVIPTGAESIRQIKNDADREKQRADKLAAKLRALGIDPSKNGV